MLTDHPLLQIRDLKKYYPVSSSRMGHRNETVKAVDGVSLEVFSGETLGLVGESGCGKTTLGYCVVRLIEPTSGEIRFEDRNILRLGCTQMQKLRREIQIVFQDPYSSLNPRMRVKDTLAEPFRIHNLCSRKEEPGRIAELLEAVGLDIGMGEKYPHEFSGGQRQRIGIARALALKPKLIVADEPVSALDISVQAQVVNLLQDLQEQYHLTYLFISHGIPVVARISSRIAVMYLGRLVEVGDSQDILQQPAHPYTQSLLASVPDWNDSFVPVGVPLPGEIPSPVNPPGGCRFHTRCPYVMERCKTEEPVSVQVSPSHQAWCHLLKGQA